MRKFAVAIACAAMAASQPTVADTQTDLKKTQAELAESKARSAELNKKQAKLKRELGELQRQLVRAVKAIQKNEQSLLDTQVELEQTVRQQEAAQAQIEENKDRLESLVNVALRFSRMPPEAMVMAPETGKQTLRVSKALAMLSDDIKRQTNALNMQKSELETISARLNQQKTKAEKQKTALNKKRGALDSQLKERKRLQASLASDQKKEADTARSLAKKARGLQDLVKKLAAQQKQKVVTADRSAPAASARRGRLRSFAAAKGRIRMPATGRLKENYGKKGKSGSGSKGITLSTASGAQVVAPYDGEVIFTGTFMHYGRMTILRHSDDFLTLLAGFKRIDVQTGEFLLEGEPIGAMGNTSNQQRLYVELRKNNQPVNPKPWIKGL